MKDEMDILRELSSIASAHGSKALSEMLNKRINLSLPSLETVNLKQLEEKISTEKIVICVETRILTGLSGSIVLILEEKNAFRLINMCCESNIGGTLLTELGFSAIKEIGNVVIGAYVGALSIILQTPIIPSIPTLISGPFQEIIHSIAVPYTECDSLLLIEAFFEAADQKIKGGFYFILTPKTMNEIQNVCKKLLSDI